MGKTGGNGQILPEKDQVLGKGGGENWREWSNLTRKNQVLEKEVGKTGRGL